MIKLIQLMLKETNAKTPDILRAKGAHKYPENWSEFVNYIKTRE